MCYPCVPFLSLPLPFLLYDVQLALVLALRPFAPCSLLPTGAGGEVSQGDSLLVRIRERWTVSLLSLRLLPIEWSYWGDVVDEYVDMSSMSAVVENLGEDAEAVVVFVVSLGGVYSAKWGNMGMEELRGVLRREVGSL